MSLLRKTKRNYYAQLDNKIVTDNKKVWKAGKAFRKESIILKKHVKPLLITKI